jgi:peptidyl-prolyl cis-trans isomerase B (cyclophilin B)
VLALALVPVAVVAAAMLAVAVLSVDGVADIAGVAPTPTPAPAAAPPAEEPACAQFNPVAPAPEPAVPPPPARPPASALAAVVHTSCGDIRIALASRRAPRTVASFVHLARRGVYDQSDVYRVLRGRRVEAGDPTRTGRGGPGYTVTEPSASAAAGPRWTVGMLRPPGAPPGTSGSRFAIATGRGGLPRGTAVVGRVTGGFATLRAIEALTRRGARRPARPVPIAAVDIVGGR